MKKNLSSILLMLLFVVKLQAITTISIKTFGARGNGKTNDHEAFIKAANYINQKGGNVNLLIPKGIYIIGKQVVKKNNEIYIEGIDLFALKNCSNVNIIGTGGTKLKYTNGLKFGSFNPVDGKEYYSQLPFYGYKYITQIGCAFRFTNCNKIEMKKIEIDGNVSNTFIGGKWGDNGYQLWHYGIYISSCSNITINNISAHHFALDGISISDNGKQENKITLLNSKFEYNARQGLSWIGGNGLVAQNCKFNHTGRSKIASPPGAGVDIEAENGNEAKNGKFINCEFVNNIGSGLTANTGPSQDITFESCTFWGVTTWSAWVDKPNYTFNNCKFHGSFVHGYATKSELEATKFNYCLFEDKRYNGSPVYGSYLLESDSRKMMKISNCTFIANEKKVIWFNGVSSPFANEKAILENCTIHFKNNNLARGSFWGVIRKMRIKNLTINYYTPKDKNYYLEADSNTEDGLQINYLTDKKHQK